MSNIQSKIKSLSDIYRPFRNIVWFLILFVGIDFIWKLFIDEGNNVGGPFVLGKNIEDTVEPICLLTAKVTHWVVRYIFGHDNIVLDKNLIYFADNLWMKFRVVWECTGVKQIIVFGALIGLYLGPIKQKFWFIPLSLLILYTINILRIAGIILITKDGFPDWFISFNEWNNNRIWDNSNESFQIFYNDWFDLFHRDIFGWLYSNGAIFLLWLWWEERFNLPYQKRKNKSKINNKQKEPSITDSSS